MLGDPLIAPRARVSAHVAGQYWPTAVDLEVAAVVDATGRPVFLVLGSLRPVYVVDNDPFPPAVRAS